MAGKQRNKNSFSCLAVDMGASNIRIVLGKISDKLEIKEIHRFENKMVNIGGHLRWDLENIQNCVTEGIRKAIKVTPDEIESIGVDSWGVDFVLLDDKGEYLEYPVTYRDDRIAGMPEEWAKLMDPKETFTKTGVNFYPFNSLFQFLSLKGSDLIKKTSRILFIADYINYFLTHIAASELSLASTTQMLSVNSSGWDPSILKKLDIQSHQLCIPQKSGYILGNLRKEVGGIDAQVTVVAGHDSASAVFSIPYHSDNFAFLLTGTWCIMGALSDKALTSYEALESGITNEISAGGEYMTLKNLMGLWLVQRLREDFAGNSSYQEIEEITSNTPPSEYLIDTSDELFYNPKSMKQAFDQYIKVKYKKEFLSEREYYRCAFDSISFSFYECLKKLESLRNRKFECIHLTGGGAQSKLLCQLTADVTGLTVYAGPVEGASVGNILMQALAFNHLSSSEECRQVVRNSFEIQQFHPNK